MSDGLTEFENRVLRAFCEKSDVAVSDLADQLEALKVRSREQTGVGIFIEFERSQDRKSDPSAVISGVNGLAADGSVEIGFLLFVRGGVVEMLEGFSYTGSWPSDPASCRLVLV